MHDREHFALIRRVRPRQLARRQLPRDDAEGVDVARRRERRAPGRGERARAPCTRASPRHAHASCAPSTPPVPVARPKSAIFGTRPSPSPISTFSDLRSWWSIGGVRPWRYAMPAAMPCASFSCIDSEPVTFRRRLEQLAQRAARHELHEQADPVGIINAHAVQLDDIVGCWRSCAARNSLQPLLHRRGRPWLNKRFAAILPNPGCATTMTSPKLP